MRPSSDPAVEQDHLQRPDDSEHIHRRINGPHFPAAVTDCFIWLAGNGEHIGFDIRRHSQHDYNDTRAVYSLMTTVVMSGRGTLPIYANDKHVTAGEEKLRIVRGPVRSSTGSKNLGSGFTTSRTATRNLRAK